MLVQHFQIKDFIFFDNRYIYKHLRIWYESKYLKYHYRAFKQDFYGCKPFEMEINTVSWYIQPILFLIISRGNGCFNLGHGVYENLRQFLVTFATDCSELMNIVLEPKKWSAFVTYLEGIQRLKESFTSVQILHVSRTQNTRTYTLARSARSQPPYLVFIDVESPCLVNKVLILFVYADDKK